MEKDTTYRIFQWEYHLNKFRGLKSEKAGSEDWRKHKYIRNISLMLLVLSTASGILFVIVSKVFTHYDTLNGTVFLFMASLLTFGIYIFRKRWRQLVHGEFTSNSVKLRWKRAIEECDLEL